MQLNLDPSFSCSWWRRTRGRYWYVIFVLFQDCIFEVICLSSLNYAGLWKLAYPFVDFPTHFLVPPFKTILSERHPTNIFRVLKCGKARFLEKSSLLLWARAKIFQNGQQVCWEWLKCPLFLLMFCIKFWDSRDASFDHNAMYRKVINLWWTWGPKVLQCFS